MVMILNREWTQINANAKIGCVFRQQAELYQDSRLDMTDAFEKACPRLPQTERRTTRIYSRPMDKNRDQLKGLSFYVFPRPHQLPLQTARERPIALTPQVVGPQ